MNTGTQVPGTLSRNYIEQDLQAIVTHTLQLGYTDIVGTVSMFPIRGSLLLSLSLSLSLCVCVVGMRTRVELRGLRLSAYASSPFQLVNVNTI